MSWAIDLLPDRGFFLGREISQLDHLSSLSCLIDRPHDSHVCQSFEAGRLGLFVFENAVREIDQLGSELVTFGKFSSADPFADRYPLLQRNGIILGRLGRE